ncbi:protein-L-isoaspartate O-methyltransferase family protein [Microvirga lotononidis]|uniref:Protein-L-isoaspartate O-methyltransferase n=1 Tax=Microvirga lotononidis TaxID=864069 RepID=I4YKQ2_9HYPH|nr:SAM-dependent methyltransferase [Microvirga lotononidis]EIM24544.1 protein-L-isoaspartate carboxylmethyltransferase [Microvirga lotononidis]WQO26563.1 SAM-dependent methyltransferase [Microvirga lotononidis]
MPQEGSDHYRRAYARQIARLAEVRDGRIELAFESVPREAFLPPPPWTAISMGVAVRTSEIADIYDNVLVAIDPERGINNGEPALHAAWIDAARPRPGEAVIHVGAGTGYYTAILALLVQPDGRVEAFEYEADLAAQAARNLSSYANVTVHAASAFGRALPKADIVYVNAGVLAPDVEWLRALNPGGRLIFPWQPHKGWGPALLVTRRAGGFSVQSLMNVGFISCSGTTERISRGRLPTEADLAAVRSIWIGSTRAPDSSAVAVYDDVWFSSEKPGH